MIAAITATVEPILPEAEPLWQLWLGCQTQWRLGVGGAIGLDYVAVAQVATWTSFQVDAWAFGVLRRMETACLEIWHCE